MDCLAQLASHTEQLSNAVTDLVKSGHTSQSFEALNREMPNAKANILGSIASIKALISGPDDLLQELAAQVETLACLQWLAESQILACIPLDLSIPTKDLADLAGFPVSQLSRVIRLLATRGFLQEQEPSSVAHTPLSAYFLTNQSLLDASVFMAESVVPAALQSPKSLQRRGAAYGGPAEAAMGAVRPFLSALQERPKLRRQWAAYQRHAAGLHQEEQVLEVISGLNWSNLGSACIVEVNAKSTSMARSLAERFPNLRLTVQIRDDQPTPSLHENPTYSGTNDNPCRDSNDGLMEPDPPQANINGPSSCGTSLSVTYRSAGMPQHVKDAAVYILHLPTVTPRPSLGGSSTFIIKSELQSYLGPLRVNGSILLVLTTRLLPEPGSPCGPVVETVARARDLCMRQLAGEGEMEMSEILGMIEATRDNGGRLVVTNQLRAHNNLVVGLVVKHQAS
ncbi:hypothetical protein KVR01_011590 [Diaporthe batatas]|uniref:uncharacterized protein n=1 Tax=Diaporthe batatas TaxID=748121 RepID=UPI001D03ADDB|nr:uncharacterized protein KVR01_011590 [Diaporthe batatas]KAG8158468.1 hypothetical protein KVR01_011590 [Diaporthe batatas]